LGNGLNDILKNMISVILQGRIGNQLFIYAIAEQLRLLRGKDEDIYFYDYDIHKQNWVNSLEDYNLNNIHYIHHRFPYKLIPFFQYLVVKLFNRYCKGRSFMDKYHIETKYQPLLNWFGIMICENGYVESSLVRNNHIMLYGFFQSPRYFETYRNVIIEPLRLKKEIESLNLPLVKKIYNRNAVCISIKVEHNVGSSLYDVCCKEYWSEAINYIISNVSNPLFFICSDNIDYVINNLIDTTKFDFVSQDKDLPVHISLGIMSLCKHYIIGNTSFGWWAQALCEYKDKIVVAPNPWMRVEMPVDIYEKGWHIIDVQKYF